MTFQQRSHPTPCEPLTLSAKALLPESTWLREGDTFTFCHSNTPEAKIAVDVGTLLQDKKVLSFNFCKKGDSFRNILVTLEIAKEEEGQVLIVADFITITNLTSEEVWVDGRLLGVDAAMAVDLPPNLANEYNNKAVRQGDVPLELIYKHLFDYESP